CSTRRPPRGPGRVSLGGERIPTRTGIMPQPYVTADDIALITSLGSAGTVTKWKGDGPRQYQTSALDSTSNSGPSPGIDSADGGRQDGVFAVVPDAEGVVEQVEHVDVADEERQLDQLRIGEALLQLLLQRGRDPVGVAHHRPRVLDRDPLARRHVWRQLDELQGLLEDVRDLDQVATGARAELT